ncbi:MAG: hypothetical protein ACI33P_09600, partial [Lysinibacillus sp.]
MLVNLLFILVQTTVSVKYYYKSSLLITILFTLWVILMSPYVDLIVFGYLICLQFWLMSIACYNMRDRTYSQNR